MFYQKYAPGEETSYLVSFESGILCLLVVMGSF